MKPRLKLVIAGRNGRMGREIESVASEFGLDVVGGFGRTTTLAEWLKSGERPDVVIDFSLPAGTVALAETCAKEGISLVSGVTGLGDTERCALETAGSKVAVLYSANMSVGIQMLAKALDALKGVEGFELAIEEIHHRHKRDRPSGTALLLNDELQTRTGRKASEVVSLRGGGVIGVHRVMAFSDSETLVFEHTALNRGVFARGACHAARWIAGRGPGFYGLRDTLS